MDRCQYRVGFSQIKINHKDVEKNIEKIEKITKENSFDILVFPELSTTGYYFDNRKDLKKISFQKDDEIFDTLEKLCKDGFKNIVFGFSEKDGEKIYNSSMMITFEGKRFVYRKTHLFFKEKNLFDSGDTGFFVVKLKNIKVGMMICFDWFFPESARTLALKGAQLILHPSNLVMPYCQDAMITRSIENRVFSITSNRIGREGGYNFTGKSQIVSFDGKIIHRAKSLTEEVFITDIDLEKAKNKKINEMNDLFKDRRGEYYVC